MKKFVKLVLVFVVMINIIACTEPLITIDSSNNVLNVGSKYKDDRIINFRSKRIR